MTHRTAAVLLAAAAITTALVAVAQPQPGAASGPNAMKKQFAAMIEKSSAPTEQHKVLSAFVGEFDQATEVKMGPGEPMKARSTGHGRWIMGGRFVQVDSASSPDEEFKGERMLIYGYDPAAKKYTLWNVESGSLTSTSATGDYDAPTKTFTFEGERDQPGGTKAPFRWILKIENDGSIAQQILAKAAGSDQYFEVVKVQHTLRPK